ncbi:MAG: FUSC family protein [Gammaproteobacteria bacterium]|nr:FUSC family protein [Gammaproteobacteria bacterium]
MAMPITLLHKPLRATLVVGLQTVLITGLSYYLGEIFTAVFHGSSAQIGGLWSALSGLIVLQSTIRETLKSSLLRLIGTFIGALICAIYLWLFGFSIIGMALCAGLTMSICYLLNIFEYARLAAVTVVIIAVISVRTPDISPFLNSFLRFCEAVIGVGICIACVYGLRPLVWQRG